MGVSQIREQLEVVEVEVENGKFVITTLRNVCQKEVIAFSRVWKKEEARLIIREEKMGAIEDQALTIQEDTSSDEEYEGINS